MTKNEKVINSKLANTYWYFIVIYKGTESFKNLYYEGATRIDLNGSDELIVTYIDRVEKIPMYYTRVKLNMFNFLDNHINSIEWI